MSTNDDTTAATRESKGCCQGHGGMGARMRRRGGGDGGPDPMAMMKKMMARMGGEQGGDEAGAASMPPMMKACMSMCAEMTSAIERSAEMAAFATPELRRLFADWLDTLADEALRHVDDHGATDPATLATALNIGEDSAAILLARLARDGKIAMRFGPATEPAATA